MTNLREHFLLDPNIVFLNHGSFGATPKPVFNTYQKWQRKLENQPVLFLGREYNELLRNSRQILGKYLSADAEDLVFIPNATYGVNIIARSLQLMPGDVVLTSNHEYGACDYAWNFICQKSDARYIHHEINLPVNSDEEIIESFFEDIPPTTKVIYLSHITSPTALTLPIEKMCLRARKLGLLTIIDGAHAMGQIPLALETIGADFYISNCHKWSLAPKGAAFLYARKNVQSLVEPLVVSWGYGNVPKVNMDSRFVNILQWTGTNDPAAALSVPAAIQFMEDFNWESVRHDCHVLLQNALARICDLTEMTPVYPFDSDFFFQMGVAPLPDDVDIVILKQRLYNEYKIEVPLTQLGEKKFIRVSVQAYNTESDIDKLLSALNELL